MESGMSLPIPEVVVEKSVEYFYYCPGCGAVQYPTVQDFSNGMQVCENHDCDTVVRFKIKIQDQPPPIPRTTAPIWELVIKDMQDRHLAGVERYGTALRAFDGRNTLVDAYQEALDLTVYLRKAIEEAGSPDK